MNNHSAHESHRHGDIEEHLEHGPSPEHGGHKGMDHGDHHAHMIADFKRRFRVSLIFTFPILAFSPMIQNYLGFSGIVEFPGEKYALFACSSIIYFYGGYPFTKGLVDEVKSSLPGMMTLIAVAITTAYIYSSAVVFGVVGNVFFWELATLIDVMLLGHWIEMRSVMGASRALEELARLMPGGGPPGLPDFAGTDWAIPSGRKNGLGWLYRNRHALRRKYLSAYGPCPWVQILDCAAVLENNVRLLVNFGADSAVGCA